MFLLGNDNANPIERELANKDNVSIGNNLRESDLHIRTNSSDGNEIRNFGHEGQLLRQDRSLDSMQTFSNEIIMRPSQEMDTMMSMMHSQIKRALSSAISERMIPESQNIFFVRYLQGTGTLSPARHRITRRTIMKRLG